jgi:hypothetical protein
VPNLSPPRAHERDVLGDARRRNLAREIAEAARALVVDALGGAKPELHSVWNDRPDLRNCASFSPRVLARKTTLRDDLDEVRGPSRGEQIARQLRAPPDPRPMRLPNPHAGESITSCA